MMAGPFSTIRIVALAIVSLFSFIVLALTGFILSIAPQNIAALSLATAVLTILSLPAMLIVDSMRKGAFTSMILVELVWLGILWVLWLSSAATGIYCGDAQICQAVQAFDFINWLILLAYTLSILVLSVIAASRGNPVWTLSVGAMEANAAVAAQFPKPPLNQPQFAGSNLPVSEAQYPSQLTPPVGWGGQSHKPSTQSQVIQV